MDRIKDLLYDVSDLLISLLIIAIIFLVISWKLNETIPIEDGPASTSVEKTQPLPSKDTPTAVAKDTTDASDADKPITDTTKPPATDTTEQKTADGREITITIPNGATGYAIGKILKDNSLVSDINDFIHKVDEMGLGPKLRSGTFELNTAMSLEDIIKIIANVK